MGGRIKQKNEKKRKNSWTRTTVGNCRGMRREVGGGGREDGGINGDGKNYFFLKKVSKVKM